MNCPDGHQLSQRLGGPSTVRQGLIRALLLGWLCAAQASWAASAKLEARLSAPTLTLARGSSSTLRVVLRNATEQRLYLGGVTSSFPREIAPASALDSLNAQLPVFLEPRQGWEGPMIQLSATPSTPISRAVHSVTFWGGSSTADREELASLSARVEVIDANCSPIMVSAPSSQPLVPGQPATFTVVASRGLPFTYQWRRDGVPLMDDGHLSGVNTDRLVIASASADDAGAYDVRVSNTCGSVLSPSAALGAPVLLASPEEKPRPRLALERPYPNPMRGRATIVWAKPQSGLASLAVHDVSGRLVATLFRGQATAGRHEDTWNGRSDRGGIVRPGVYWIRLWTPDRSLVRKVVLLP